MSLIAVTVLDRFSETQAWGRGGRQPVLRTVQIADHCPKCGGKRGAPRMAVQYENGQWFGVSRWDNPCGHIDSYAAVLREAGVHRGD